MYSLCSQQGFTWLRSDGSNHQFRKGWICGDWHFSKKPNNGQRARLWLFRGLGEVGRVSSRLQSPSRAREVRTSADIYCWTRARLQVARASYQACVKPPDSPVSQKLAPECSEPAWPCAFWTVPGGAAFMRTLWIVNSHRGHELIFNSANTLNASTGKTLYSALVAQSVRSAPSQTQIAPIGSVWRWFINLLWKK